MTRGRGPIERAARREGDPMTQITHVTGDRWHVADDQVIGCDPDQIAAVARERGTCLRRGIVVR
jgi:hypothetical protein